MVLAGGSSADSMAGGSWDWRTACRSWILGQSPGSCCGLWTCRPGLHLRAVRRGLLEAMGGVPVVATRQRVVGHLTDGSTGLLSPWKPERLADGWYAWRRTRNPRRFGSRPGRRPVRSALRRWWNSIKISRRVSGTAGLALPRAARSDDDGPSGSEMSIRDLGNDGSCAVESQAADVVHAAPPGPRPTAGCLLRRAAGRSRPVPAEGAARQPGPEIPIHLRTVALRVRRPGVQRRRAGGRLRAGHVLRGAMAARRFSTLRGRGPEVGGVDGRSSPWRDLGNFAAAAARPGTISGPLPVLLGRAVRGRLRLEIKRAPPALGFHGVTRSPSPLPHVPERPGSEPFSAASSVRWGRRDLCPMAR
jgi:hypothetical protein